MVPFYFYLLFGCVFALFPLVYINLTLSDDLFVYHLLYGHHQQRSRNKTANWKCVPLAYLLCFVLFCFSCVILSFYFWWIFLPARFQSILNAHEWQTSENKLLFLALSLSLSLYRSLVSPFVQPITDTNVLNTMIKTVALLFHVCPPLYMCFALVQHSICLDSMRQINVYTSYWMDIINCVCIYPIEMEMELETTTKKETVTRQCFLVERHNCHWCSTR